MKRARIMLGAFSAASIVYGIAVIMTLGTEAVSHFTFLIAGIVFAIAAAAFPLLEMVRRKTRLVVMLALCVIIASFAMFLIEAITTSMYHPVGEAEYVVVVGTDLDKDVPGYEYQKRLECAADYMKTYAPKAKLIISGGQAENEEISRAAAGKKVMTQLGISASQIYLEEESFKTKQHIDNVLKVIERLGGNADSSMVFVTSKFNAYLVRLVADSADYTNITCAGSVGHRWLWPQYYVEEYGHYMQGFLTNSYKARGNSFSNLFKSLSGGK